MTESREGQSRRLAAILAADIEGYSRLMSADEGRTVSDLKAHQAVVLPMVGEFGGRVIDTAGDGILAEFASVLNAVKCAIEIQKAMARRNSAVDPERKMQFRIGINQGDVVYDENRIYGDGINIAARLESLADPGGLSISSKVYDEIAGRLDVTFEDAGEQHLKNIARPVRMYRVQSFKVTKEAESVLSLPSKPSIVVLPFSNMSGDSEQDYFADGMTEEVTTALARVSWMFVIARNSAFTYKGRAVDIKQVGRELGVRYVLEGSARRAGNRVRITGQLLDAENGAHLWADRFDGVMEEVFELQDNIASSIVGAIEPQMRTAEARRAVSKPTASPQAYDHFLRALAAFHLLTRESLETTLAECRKAIERDRAYSSAYGLAAWCYAWRDAQMWTVDQEQERAGSIRYARLAVEYGADDPTALWMAGHTLAYSGAGNEEGARIIDRALTLNSNSALAWAMSGYVRAYIGDCKTAIEHLKKAMRLSPLDPLGYTFKQGTSLAYFNDQQYEEAIKWADLALAEQPKFAATLRVRVAALALLGRISEAKEAGRILLAITPGFTLADVPNRGWRTQYLTYVDGLRKAGIPEA